MESEKELSLEDAKLLLRQSYDLGVRYVDFTGGEPTLYPYLKEIIEYAKQLGIKTEVTSNCISSSSNDPFQDYMGQKAIILDDLRDKAFINGNGTDNFEDLLKKLRNC